MTSPTDKNPPREFWILIRHPAEGSVQEAYMEFPQPYSPLDKIIHVIEKSAFDTEREKKIFWHDRSFELESKLTAAEKERDKALELRATLEEKLTAMVEREKETRQ